MQAAGTTRFLSRKGRRKPIVEVFEQRRHTPVLQGDHIPSHLFFSCSKGHDAVGKSGLNPQNSCSQYSVTHNAGCWLLALGLPTKARQLHSPHILDIQGSPGWYQWIWSPAQPTQMRGHGAHSPGKGMIGPPQLEASRAPYTKSSTVQIYLS